MSDIDELKKQLKNEFEMKDLGATKKILGMEIKRNRKEGKLFLTQRGYIEKALERFGMKNVKPASTLLTAHFRLSATLSPKIEIQALLELDCCSSDRTSFPSVKQFEFASISKTLNSNLSMKLTRDNFIHWRAQILPAIRALSLEEYINGGRLSPNKVVEISATDGTTKSVINEDFVAWCKTDQLLLCWLMSIISEGLISEVTDCQSSLEFWRIIETLFSRESLAKVLQLKQQLQSVRKGLSTISEFILKIKGLGNGLRSARQTVTDQDLLLSVLNGLGHEYDPVVVMLSQQQLTMSLHEAQYMLMIHEQRIEHLNSVAQVEVPAVPSVNFVSNTGGKGTSRGGHNNRGRGGQNGNNRGGRRGRGGRWNNNRPHCQICGRSGHLAIQCYSRYDCSYQQQPHAHNHSPPFSSNLSSISTQNPTVSHSFQPVSSTHPMVTRSKLASRPVTATTGRDGLLAMKLSKFGSEQRDLSRDQGALAMKAVHALQDFVKCFVIKYFAISVLYYFNVCK
ncbi:hypothetical protein ACOSQ4_017422 [Xanthoceras sorbifolium]